jgi:hypothetical protein
MHVVSAVAQDCPHVVAALVHAQVVSGESVAASLTTGESPLASVAAASPRYLSKSCVHAHANINAPKTFTCEV